jgi:hypothetical protein
MPEIGTSSSMSEDGKRGVGHRPQATAPILDSTIAPKWRCPLLNRLVGIGRKRYAPAPRSPSAGRNAFRQILQSLSASIARRARSRIRAHRRYSELPTSVPKLTIAKIVVCLNTA